MMKKMGNFNASAAAEDIQVDFSRLFLDYPFTKPFNYFYMCLRRDNW